MRALGGTLLLIGLAVAYLDPSLLSLGSRPQDAIMRAGPPAEPENPATAAVGPDDAGKGDDAGPATAPPDLDLVWVTMAEARAQGDGSTVFSMVLSRGLTAEVYTLSSPYRVIIDMPEVVFALAPGSGKEGSGLVRTFRYGLFSEGQGRVVLDTEGPVRIAKAEMVRGGDGRGREVRFDIRLAPMEAGAFGQGTGAGLAAKPSAVPPDVAERPEKTGGNKPIVVIDAGHGGIDPGAVGRSNTYEKTIVLAVSLALRDALQKTGKYRVRMTREKDVFLSLDKRLHLSRIFGADLFLSIHADSVAEEAVANAISGATVYTLSDRASDEQARLMAEKENASDLLAGIAADDAGGGDVSSILIDLMQRESSNFSTDFSNLLVRTLKNRIKLARKPKRSAAFKVLKQTHAPAVLIELGYLTNPGDEERLKSPEWQAKVAQAIMDAVDSYFSKLSALRR